MDIPAVTPFYEWQQAPRATFAVIGDPIAHSLSPVMHEFAHAEIGTGMRYVAIRASRADFPHAIERLRDLGYLGVNVTVPLKTLAARILPNVEPFVQWCGSANCLDFRRTLAVNTDAPGFIHDLCSLGWSPSNRVLLLGAGGAAQAIACGLATEGADIAIYNRSWHKAASLAQRIGGTALSAPDPSGCQIVVDATSASLSGGSPPLLWDRLTQGSLLYTLGYGREQSRFLQEAERRGCIAADGRGMLVEQAALSLELWTGKTAPRRLMRNVLDQALSADL